MKGNIVCYVHPYYLYLVHTGRVETHDGGVCQAVKHGAHGFLGVELLWLEQLLHEALVEHGGRDVMHHCNRSHGTGSLLAQKWGQHRVTMRSILGQHEVNTGST